jgi:hypothetical protein
MLPPGWLRRTRVVVHIDARLLTYFQCEKFDWLVEPMTGRAPDHGRFRLGHPMILRCTGYEPRKEARTAPYFLQFPGPGHSPGPLTQGQVTVSSRGGHPPPQHAHANETNSPRRMAPDRLLRQGSLHDLDALGRACPIPAFDRPSAIRASTSRSRLVSTASGWSARRAATSSCTALYRFNPRRGPDYRTSR